VAGSASEGIRHLFTTRIKDKALVHEVVASAVPGLWEVVYGEGSTDVDLVYTNQGVDFVLNANLFDLAKGTDLTQARVKQLRAIDFGSLPLTNALVLLHGTGTRRIAVFADPLDPYSRRLQQEIEKLKDVTVYFFLVPILGPDSTAKARDILCAPSPADAWRGWIAHQRPVPDARPDCAPPALERNVILAERHRIKASPVLVFADSTRVDGWKLQEVIEKHLAAAMRVRN
jgi:thiol:disulfide interchange protein DsbC